MSWCQKTGKNGGGRWCGAAGAGITSKRNGGAGITSKRQDRKRKLKLVPYLLALSAAPGSDGHGLPNAVLMPLKELADRMGWAEGTGAGRLEKIFEWEKPGGYWEPTPPPAQVRYSVC